MANHRFLQLGSIALLTLAVAACGKTASPTMVSGATAVRSTTAVIQGVERKFGYDYARYETVLAKNDHAEHLVRQGILRGAVDNRSTCSPVADQGKLGSCTAFSMGRGLREQIEVKNGGEFSTLSGLFLYYVERDDQGDVTHDTGATIGEGIHALTNTGIAKEATVPYDIANFATKPSDAAYAEAANFKLHDAKQLASFDDVKTALNAGQTVAFGFKVYSSFRKIGADGIMPVPAWGESLLGGHAVLAVGYDDAKQMLIVRNSWSATWGDHGYFYMPYKVATGNAVHEFYTATK